MSEEAIPSDPMKLLANMMADLKDMAMRPSLGILAELPPTEHRVKIFQMDDRTSLVDVADQIEILLNNGWCCHHPAVCNNFLIMDFTRRKETPQNERESTE